MLKFIPKERDEQIKLHQYVNFLKQKNKNLILSWATPNGGSRNKIEARNMRAEGVQRGIPDYTIVFENLTLYIEMKRAKKSLSHVSKEQKEVLGKLNETKHNIAIVCYGFDEAKEAVDKYLKIDLLMSRQNKEFI